MKWQAYRKRLVMVFYLEMKNSVYYFPYDLASNEVNAIYVVHKIRKYDGSGTEHNYLFSCGMSDNHRGICFREDEKTMRIHGAVGDRKPDYMDISNFPTSYYNSCQKDRWNVVRVMHDTTSTKSLWENHGNVCDFACRLPIKPSALNLFNRVVNFDNASGFNGYIESVYKTIPSGLIAARMTYLREKYKIPKRAGGWRWRLDHVWYKLSQTAAWTTTVHWSCDHAGIGSVFGGGLFHHPISSLLE